MSTSVFLGQKTKQSHPLDFSSNKHIGKIQVNLGKSADYNCYRNTVHTYWSIGHYGNPPCKQIRQ